MTQRILVDTTSTITAEFYADGTLVDPVGDVSYTITSLDGTVLDTGTAARTSTGLFSIALTAPSSPDQLEVKWTASIGGNDTTLRKHVEIVGGFYASIEAIRSSDASLANVAWDVLDDARAEAEAEAESIMGRSFVRRYEVERLVVDDNGNVQTSRAHLQKLRKVTATRYGDAVAVELDACKIIGDSLVRIPVAAGSLVELHYEHGLDGAFAAGVVGAVRIRARQFAQSANSRVPLYSERVVVDPNGATVTRMLPGAKTTGVAEVDAVYGRLSFNFGFA